MKKITKIVKDSKDTVMKEKLRAAAYCRVSTDSEEQLVSLETQKLHYEAYIKANPNWEFAGIYYDEGISGTKKEKRSELLRLISDCEQKKIDFIVTKSISRFARNTTDCLELVRKLVDLGVYIYFEKENINTQSMESELMLSILSGLAENESLSIAENNRWSVQRRFQNGTFKISYPPYGYDYADGEMLVNLEQAEVVRFIFKEALAGKGAGKIADALNKKGIKPKRGNNWISTTIRGMLSNEKYVGDAILQKTYTDDNFNRHTNYGEKDQYYIQNHHEAIISREDFETVDKLINQRGKEKGIVKGSGKYQNRYPFSGKLKCSQCGGTFKRRIHTNGNKKYIAWCCQKHITQADECSMKFVREGNLQRAFITMMNKLIFGRKVILKPLLKALRDMRKADSISRISELEKLIEKNTEQKEMLIKLMAKGYLEPALFNKENNELEIEAESYRDEIESLNFAMNSEISKTHEVRELLRFTNKAQMLITFDGKIFESFVNQVFVYSREEVGFQMKCGITLREGL
ncbi:recombinase family protein [Clostridium aquiflavi]|uniref:Recombinase family protein n=1 Tax=Clostridium aquiflavi TaxID=3073603 RepID=A0ABU1ECM7_9CLOT|nr:recombinase family protein [Clostridium sp. 5N-1]MDR5586048.1 recombinase family protein [Clostridium sp. 5N-1]